MGHTFEDIPLVEDVWQTAQEELQDYVELQVEEVTGVYPNETQYWKEADRLQHLSIRELKRMASLKKVRKYGSLTKSQLVEALVAVG